MNAPRTVLATRPVTIGQRNGAFQMKATAEVTRRVSLRGVKLTLKTPTEARLRTIRATRSTNSGLGEALCRTLPSCPYLRPVQHSRPLPKRDLPARIFGNGRIERRPGDS